MMLTAMLLAFREATLVPEHLSFTELEKSSLD
jgi:hypothetical protein